MSYLQVDDKKLLNDLAQRTEFAIHNLTLGEQKHQVKTILPNDVMTFEPQSYQSNNAHFMDPHTPYDRLFEQWDTGVGKSLSAIHMAMEFIKMYEKESEVDLDATQGSIFIIGFTQEIFKRDLLKFPTFGYVSRQEVERLDELRRAAGSGNFQDLDRYQDLLNKFKKRLTNRKERGYFKFFGYKEFVNRIFMLENFKHNISDMDETQIRQALRDGSLKFNQQLLSELQNSFMICDEIHLVYNSVEKNNWGVAIQMVLDTVPSLKALFLSATPINNNPTEIIDLANLLNIEKYKRDDYFIERRPKPGAIEALKKAFRGRVSFIRDNNPKYFAKQTIIGDEIPNIPYLRFTRCKMSDLQLNTYKEVYTGVLAQDEQYLLDIVFPHPTEKTGIYQTQIIKRVLSTSNEEYYKKYGFRMQDEIITGHGLYRENIIKYSSKYAKLIDMLHEDLKSHRGKTIIYHDIVHISGILFIEQLLLHNGFIGINQNPTDDTLCVHCGVKQSKHPKTGGSTTEITRDVPDGIKATSCNSRCLRRYGKPVAYIVDHSGVADLIIVKDGDLEPLLNIYKGDIITDEPLKLIKYGYVAYDNQNDNQNKKYYMKRIDIVEVEDAKKYINAIYDNTSDYCVVNLDDKKITVKYDDQTTLGRIVRGLFVDEQPSIGGASHDFMPARIIMAHSEMDKSQMQKNIDRYNSPDNIFGDYCQILAGSKIISQSYDFKGIVKMYIMSPTQNISSLIQLFGRSRRKNAHSLLPVEMQNISVHILVSSLPNGLSHEEEKYRRKMEDYVIIQEIERELLHKPAIDGAVARNIIKPGLIPDKKQLGALYFEPEQSTRRYNINELNMSTFEVFHSDKLIRRVIHLIKKLFIVYQYAYTLNELHKYVLNPPFHTEFQTNLISDDCFYTALTLLIFETSKNTTRPLVKNEDDNVMDVMYSDIDKRVVQADGTVGFIHHYADIYVFVPFRDTHDINNESVYRTYRLQRNRPINVERYIKEITISANFDNQKLKFYQANKDVKFEDLAKIIGKYSVEFHSLLVEEIIKYVFDSWTNTQTARSEMHDFYFTILYYYDLMGLIVWLSTAQEYMQQQYTDYMLPIGEIVYKKDTKESYSSAVRISLDLLATRTRELKPVKKQDVVKADPHFLPIGHYLSKVPRFYHPQKSWFDAPEYIQTTDEYKENDIIVGYHEKSDKSLNIKFKIRRPKHQSGNHTDSRMIERGSVCSSNNKEYLLDIAKRLGIKEAGNIPKLCQAIEERLQLNEIEERKNKTKIRWFYSHWEEHEGKRQSSLSFSSSKN